MKEGLKKHVDEYLLNNGYPFEMHVANMFRKVGFNVFQSELFTDATTAKTRELDVLAIRNTNYNGHIFNIACIIECKYSMDHPWIAFCGISESWSHYPYTCFYVSSDSASNWLGLSYLHLADKNLFTKNENFSYGVRVASTVKTAKDEMPIDLAYKATNTLISYIKHSRERHQQMLQTHTIFLPVIAIKGALFKAELKGDNLQTSEIEEAQLIWKEQIDKVVPKIHILPEQHLQTFAEKIYNDASRLLDEKLLDSYLLNMRGNSTSNFDHSLRNQSIEKL